jgi:oligopeptidase A
MKTQDFPDWSKLTPESAAAELPDLLAEAERGVAQVEAGDPLTFEDFQWRLNDATLGLWRLWGMVRHMSSVMNSDGWRRVLEEFQPKMVAFSLRVGQSRRLNDQRKGVLQRISSCGGASVEATRVRILETELRDAELSGVSLDGERKARFNEISARLAKLSTDFSNAVLDAINAFKFEKDGKTYTIDDANYPQILKNCADREVREKVYRARSSCAPGNEPRIDEILALRKELASLLGYANPAEMSIAVKSAPSVGAVMKMIDDLDAATVEVAGEERRELEEFAKDVVPSLEPWDRAYCAERMRERRYSYSEEELKRNFEVEDVVKGLFRMAKFLYDVDVRELKGAEKPSVWHPDVRFFELSEGGKAVAHFYFDPFVRNGLKNGGAWANAFRNRCDRRGELPLALVCTNFPERDANGRSYLPMREVETLFHEFGHATQTMLTRIGEEDAAGISMVEWDAVEVASQFNENWCLDARTGIAIPADLKKKVLAAKNYRAASMCRTQLAFAKIDMLLHLGEAKDGRTPGDVAREVFGHFGVPMIPEGRFLCSFSHIFAGGYAAGYYGYKWAEVMSADCYGAFEEAGLEDDDAVRRVGREYRDTVLALGGSESAYDVFRRFRGRAPTIDAILRQQGLKR